MEHQKQRIEFYRQRTFTEKMNATFEFIRENWKPLLKYSFYLIMPVCLVQSLAMNAFFNSYNNIKDFTQESPIAANSDVYGFIANYGIWMLCMLIGMSIISGMIYAMMQTYSVRENKLENLQLDDFKNLLIRNTWKYIRIMLALILYSFVALMLIVMMMTPGASSTLITIVITIALLACLVPLLMMIPVYIFERDITFLNAIGKAWRFGSKTLGGLIGLVVVMNVIASVIRSVTMMPWYAGAAIGTFLSSSSNQHVTQSVAYKFGMYLLGLIQAYGMYVSMIIGVIAIAFHYFHAREKIEGVTIDSNISNFDEL